LALTADGIYNQAERSGSKPGGKEQPMTERRRGPDGTEDNVRDELDEAAERGKRKKDVSREVPEEEGAPGGGGVKDNVRDEWDESQRH
jgi:hypothetical protein